MIEQKYLKPNKKRNQITVKFIHLFSTQFYFNLKCLTEMSSKILFLLNRKLIASIN